jgi:S-layer protein
MSAYTADIQKLYVAYFNRPADVSGLAFWENAMATAKDPAAILKMISAQFAASAEYKATFAGMSEMQIVATVYSNLFSRTPDMDGLLFWTQRLMAHDVTVDTVVEKMAAGAQGSDVTTLTNKITAATEFTKALDTPAEAIGYAGDSANAAAKAWLTGVTDNASLSAAINADALSSTIGNVIDNGAVTGQTFVMAKGLDTITGTASNDKIIGAIDSTNAEVNTVASIDSVDGGSGKDTFVLASAQDLATASLPTIKNIEIVELQAAGKVEVDTSAVSGVTNLNVTKAGGLVDIAAAGTTDISVKLAASGNTVDVDGGKNINVALTGIDANTDTITVGAVTTAKGAVNVSATGAAAKAGGFTMSDINVTGGSTITVSQKATADAAAALKDTSGITITQGNITIAGDANTSTVVVKQDATVAEDAAVAIVAGKYETASIKFSALTAGQTLIIGGLTFTAAVDMTAAEAASAFANLISGKYPVSGDSQAGATAAKGVYSNAISGWTSGAASGDTVVFTATTKGDKTDLANTGTGTVGAPVITQGVSSSGYEGTLGVDAGGVSVTDANGTIKSITIDGYGDSSTTTTSVLETLSLSNSDAVITVADTAATLNLTVSGLGTYADAGVQFTAAPTTLNVKSVGTNFVDFVAAATETLNVSGTGSLRAEFGVAAFEGLKNVKVTETAGLRLAADVADTLVSVDTTGTTGSVVVSIDGTKATYAGGAGADTVTLVTGTAIDKAIDLGAGNDTLKFSAVVTGSTKTMSGGDGTDTLSMTAAIADSLDGAAQSFYTNFERLTINSKFGTADATGDALTLNLANLGFTNYVTTSGTMVNGVDAGATATDVLTLDKMASNGTVVLTANGSITVNVADATTGTADVLNAIVTSSTADLNAGTLTAAKVESINLTINDTQLDNNFDGVNDPVQTDTLALVADTATSVKVGGNANLNLTLTGSTKVVAVDGSAMTGALTVTAVNTTDATTITGGAGNDVLTAATGTTADVLIGGAGQDKLVANAGLDVLTGGAGNDMFVIGTASLNSSSYATITDFSAGDLIQFAAADSFKAAKISQADTAVFQDFANAALNAIGVNDLAWFQYNGNTYVVMDKGADSTTFVNGEDVIVKLTGLIDLSGASFNVTHGTIALV